jgi:uncharacterized membrane protein YbhN (UPF0104 family)
MRGVRVAFAALALAFMAAVVLGEWDKIQATNWEFRTNLLWLSLVGAVILFFLDAYGWHLILKALGHDLPASRTVQTWMVSSLARYIPGGVWSYASRVALAKVEGVSVATASLSLYLETLLLMASSLAVGSIALLWNAGLLIDPLLAAGICILPGLALHPRAVALLKRLPGRAGKVMMEIKLPTMRRTIGLYVYYLVFWILFGTVFLCFVYATYPVAYEHWLPVGVTIALSFFVGFVVVFAPGGIGVRESALYLLLLPFLPAAASLVIAIASRLWIMAAEVITLLLVLLYGRLVKRTP